MKTWTFKFKGSHSGNRKTDGTGIEGIVDLRATSVDEALAKFYLIFNGSFVRITSILEDPS